MPGEPGMSRDHRKLRVFHDGRRLTLAIYKHTSTFPKEEWYGIRQQMRRAAASVPTNIVEGSARSGTKDFCKFLTVALASANEVAYLIGLSRDLCLLDTEVHLALASQSAAVVRQLQRLVDEVGILIDREQTTRRSRNRS
jgi:four helix bundle protein